MRQYIVAGNWKMNGDEALLIAVREALADVQTEATVVVIPPYVYLPAATQHFRDTKLVVGAQNISKFEEGAYTGEISGLMLRDVGCHYVLVGHSERRAMYGETNEIVAKKFMAAQKVNITPILCVGETFSERGAGKTMSVIEASLEAVRAAAGIKAFGKAVLAYEPVWAIGTGVAATPEMAQAVHADIRKWVAKYDEGIAKNLQILYGGSVAPLNAQALFSMPDIDGGLVGGASLKPDGFAEIVAKAR
ncbi:MAG: triose-phosphate isomerase [Gammaproteobacteria bacterium]